MYYPFAYLVLEQHFLCYENDDMTGFALECSAEDICASRESDSHYSAFTVDTSYKYYIDNWFLEMNLLCIPLATIGLMVTAYYIGAVLCGFFCTMPDTYGRKKTCMFGLFLASGAQTAIILLPNFYLRTAMFFVMGLS